MMQVSQGNGSLSGALWSDHREIKQTQDWNEEMKKQAATNKKWKINLFQIIDFSGTSKVSDVNTWTLSLL